MQYPFQQYEFLSSSISYFSHSIHIETTGSNIQSQILTFQNIFPKRNDLETINICLFPFFLLILCINLVISDSSIFLTIEIFRSKSTCNVIIKCQPLPCLFLFIHNLFYHSDVIISIF
jgi:hypothetical protein